MTDHLRYILAVIVGCIAGILGGAFGLGGASLMLPLVLLTGVIADFKTAVGTVLMTMIAPTALFAIYEYYQEKKIDFVVAGILVVTAILCGYIGAKINSYYSSQLLEFYCGFIFILIGIYFFWSSKYGKHHKKK